MQWFSTPRTLFCEWPDVRALDATVLYTPNLVLTSGVMVRALDATVLYTPNLVLTSGVDGPHPV